MTSPLPAALWPIAAPLSLAYRTAVQWRNRRYDQPGRVERMQRQVISVGNITVGGTGKTPTVMWIVEQLCDAGHRPVIAMRGYGARPGELSDEESEYLHRLSERDVDVLVDPDRCASIRGYLAGNPDTDCIVLDDAFQHRRIHRDLDLVLIDATRDTFNDRVLPAGWLREPLENLRRADSVLVTRAQRGVDQRLAHQIERYHGRPAIAWSRHQWSELHLYDASGQRSEPVEWLAGRQIVTLMGIGNPDAMTAQLRAEGAIVRRDVPVRDHQHYSKARMETLAAACAGTDAIVTTGKDWVKLRSLIQLDRWPVPIVVPQIVLEIFEGAEALQQRVQRVFGAETAELGMTQLE